MARADIKLHPEWRRRGEEELYEYDRPPYPKTSRSRGSRV